ncbi:hypothetical protein PR048_016184 [Dryococelus australis]|uniref:Retrovirus-related Pol polyprotein from transposon TNT 1-94-like beta-barrel domain-containing protein n=1 Tax=Dryococelus australis TaxID=614101 RepID=A0ABQ9HJ14_9NEOP|nr:hypothetical protein PR048_016184 [Dryococelus australis]
MPKEQRTNFDSTFEARVNVANETCVSCTVKGDVDVILSNVKAKNISNLLHVPDLITNLFSVSKFGERNFIAVFDDDACKVFKEYKVTVSLLVLQTLLFTKSVEVLC